MKLSQKYFRIRLTLLTTFVMILFSANKNFSLISDYLTSKKDLETATFIIKRISLNIYDKNQQLKSGILQKCLDIEVYDKLYFIRLSKKSLSNKWNQIQENFSSGDTIDITFKRSSLKENILCNPNELKINNISIIAFEENKDVIWFEILLITCLTLLLSFVCLVACNTYKNELLKSDKILYKINKWKLLGKWIVE